MLLAMLSPVAVILSNSTFIVSCLTHLGGSQSINVPTETLFKLYSRHTMLLYLLDAHETLCKEVLRLFNYAIYNKACKSRIHLNPNLCLSSLKPSVCEHSTTWLSPKHTAKNSSSRSPSDLTSRFQRFKFVFKMTTRFTTQNHSPHFLK